MKLKWLIVNIITAIGPPTRAEVNCIFLANLGPFCDQEATLRYQDTI